MRCAGGGGGTHGDSSSKLVNNFTPNFGIAKLFNTFSNNFKWQWTSLLTINLGILSNGERERSILVFEKITSSSSSSSSRLFSCAVSLKTDLPLLLGLRSLFLFFKHINFQGSHL